MAVNEREIILDCLIEINEKGALSHLVLGDVLLKYDYLTGEKKAFIKKVTEGTVEKLIVIDEVINAYLKNGIGKQKPLVRNLLRMSVYQILFLDKIPDSAVCNEAVKLAKSRGFSGLSGLVNGVLRNICRHKGEVTTDKCGVPEWIREHLVSCYGEDKTKAILDDIDKVHPVTVRLRKDGTDMSVLTPSGILPFAYYLKERVSPRDVRGYEEGTFVIQDVAGMHVALMAEIKSGDNVLDLCAAPGMKSLHAYDMGANVTACDISERKTDLINENIKRCVHNTPEHYIKTVVSDATEFKADFEGAFDVVLADVPCSGLGVMGRKSDIRHKTKKEDLNSLSEYQKKIIDNAVRYVKRGGRLVYSTCTLNPSENEENARYIVDEHGFKLVKESQFFPGIDGTDGFYIAVLIKN